MAKTARLELRLTPDEKAAIETAAEGRHMTVSEWVLDAVRGEEDFGTHPMEVIGQTQDGRDVVRMDPETAEDIVEAQDAKNEAMERKIAERPTLPPLVSPALRPPIPKKD